MGRTGKWIRSFLTGKKDKDKLKEKDKALASGNDQNPATTPISTLPTTPKEKKRWSFRRSSASGGSGGMKEGVETSSTVQLPLVGSFDLENEQKKHAMAMAAATAAAADAAAAAAQAAAAVIRLTAAAKDRSDSAIEEAAAIKIQSVFRSYLARKALCALKGLVKLQALVRGHLVRKQATVTLQCMQALVTAQARARAQRLRMVEEQNSGGQRNSIHRKSTKENRFSNANYESDRGTEENIKIVEMDMGDCKGSTKSRNSYSHQSRTERREHRPSSYYGSNHGGYSNPEACQVSPAPSALTEMSPRAYSGHFEDYSISTTQSSPQYYSAVSKPDPSRIPLAFPRPEYAESMAYDYPLYPNYMANTESSRAKARSQSAPKQRPDSYERPPSRRRASVEGRNVPRGMKMQRSSSHVGATAQNYQFPWASKLYRSTVSLKDSECGSTSTVLTNTNYCRSLVGFDDNGSRY